MIRLRVRQDAESDIQGVLDWYESEEPGLGARFLAELRSTFNRIRTIPRQFPDVGQGVRRALLGRFPHAIYFLLHHEREVVIVAVLHQRRNADAWMTRTAVEPPLPVHPWRRR